MIARHRLHTEINMMLGHSVTPEKRLQKCWIHVDCYGRTDFERQQFK